MLVISRSLLGVLLLLATACQPNPAPPRQAAESPLATDAEAHAHQEADAGPSQAHAGHDTDREPQPLLPIMLGMSADLTGLLQALWLDDYATLSERARHLAEHAPISADELARIESVLGPEMAAFEAADATVHEAAVRMSRAAEARDIDRLLTELATVQRGCVACHTQFRDRLRTTGR